MGSDVRNVTEGNRSKLVVLANGKRKDTLALGLLGVQEDVFGVETSTKIVLSVADLDIHGVEETHRITQGECPKATSALPFSASTKASKSINSLSLGCLSLSA